MSESLWPHGLQHIRLPSPSLSQSLLKLVSIESGMSSNHLLLCHSLPSGPILCRLSAVVVQSINHVQLFVTPWTAAQQASLSNTISPSLLKLMSIESVMPSNHLIFCCPLLLPTIFPNIRVFYSESVLPIKWPKCWSFSFSISPSNEYLGLISFRITCWPS